MREYDPNDPLNPARGVINGLLIVLVPTILVIAVIWLLVAVI